jgi:hypothetical protein
MTPQQQSILNRYGISNPPEWSGMAGQGADTLYSIGGKWMKAGQKHPSGYTVGQYDPKSKALGMSIHGVNIPVGMKSSTIQNFENPPDPYEDPTLHLFKGGMPALSQQLKIQKQIKEMEEANKMNSMSLDEIAKSPEYGFDKKHMDRIRKTIMGSGGMSDAQLEHLIHIEDYAKGVKNKTLKPNTNYYVPKSDGQMDVFTTRGESDYQ